MGFNIDYWMGKVRPFTDIQLFLELSCWLELLKLIWLKCDIAVVVYLYNTYMYFKVRVFLIYMLVYVIVPVK